MRYPNIAAERARLGLSADQLTNKIGVTRKTLYNWEAQGKIPKNKLIAMAELFACSVDYLLATEKRSKRNEID